MNCPKCKEGTLEESMEQDTMTRITGVECDSCGQTFKVKHGDE